MLENRMAGGGIAYYRSCMDEIGPEEVYSEEDSLRVDDIPEMTPTIGFSRSQECSMDNLLRDNSFRNDCNMEDWQADFPAVS